MVLQYAYWRTIVNGVWWLAGASPGQEVTQARERLALADTAHRLARQQADRATDREGVARQAQQRCEGWLERHPDVIAQDRERGAATAGPGRGWGRRGAEGA
jgi:hypothetical protein